MEELLKEFTLFNKELDDHGITYSGGERYFDFLRLKEMKKQTEIMKDIHSVLGSLDQSLEYVWKVLGDK